MGMSDQVGNELDEFTTETLRNNLLGLPLDLASINMARARSEGVPALNVFRRQLFNRTNDGQLKPYTSWVDFGENIKHPESLVNFVAAYGQHPTILADAGADGQLADDPDTEADETADNGPATLKSRREAARRLVNPVLGETNVPADATDFMNSTGDWANDGDKSITGLDKVDLWVGGLAEMTNPFGGLLGTTFNYVFENQLTDLQNGDRLYYLARTPGMNLRAQLEGNSFAEMMMRNTTVHTLKADAFATADCKFELSNLAGTPAGLRRSSATRSADDPASECDETALLDPAAQRHHPVPRLQQRGPARGSTARPSTTARPASTASAVATTTTPSGAAWARTSSRVAPEPTSRWVARAATSSPTSVATTCPRVVPATTRSMPGPAWTS